MERKLRFLTTLTVSALLLVVLSASAKIGSGVITADALRVREKPTTESGILGLLQNSTTVAIEGQEEDWYVISFGGGVYQGTEITLQVSGPDEEAAAAALEELINNLTD